MMKKKDSIVFLVQRTKTTVAISSFLFLLGSLIADLNMGGVYSTSGYSVTKMALGSLGIGRAEIERATIGRERGKGLESSRIGQNGIGIQFARFGIVDHHV